ncbi:predicted protein [Plenodomus lingam JN3]|uniref:Uncharacterized protein n=1 Tax=Leptosphaeria maculans (strain JN3 / isolate v23.1.3 / race Av1-4-5-6-7-8) TaxID=985895 RepID=E5A6Y0_LEPMJ|nr:predicted protein [Plenodomus lingam JN3]CBX99375.1 predicted protein [Plenodomus lingam JN3]
MHLLGVLQRGYAIRRPIDLAILRPGVLQYRCACEDRGCGLGCELPGLLGDESGRGCVYDYRECGR